MSSNTSIYWASKSPYFTVLLALLLYLCPFSSYAVFHLWNINEIYSNNDGSVQYIELFTQANGQQFVSGDDINSLEQDNSIRATFTFPTNSPAGTSGRYLLLATSGFSDVAGVNPDFTIPENFLSLAGGTVQFVGADMLAFGVFPSDSSLAIQNDGSVATASPTNFAGVVGSIAVEPGTDSDGDGIVDADDNCVDVANPNQENFDGDAEGDACDLDDDNDGTNDTEDAFPFNPDETVDTDGDGIGNNSDQDDDNDGMPDTYEIANGFDPLNATDADHDADGDGASNLEEFISGRNPRLNEPVIFLIINRQEIE